MKTNKGKYCSEECRRIALSKFSKSDKAPLKTKRAIMVGKNNPAWRGGVSSKNKLERVKFQKTIQKQVFERDNYTCQMCGKKGINLQVDHIQSWKEYVELRFDINNCRTLCMECHYKITFKKDKPEHIKTWGHNLSNIFFLEQ